MKKIKSDNGGYVRVRESESIPDAFTVTVENDSDERTRVRLTRTELLKFKASVDALLIENTQ